MNNEPSSLAIDTVVSRTYAVKHALRRLRRRYYNRFCNFMEEQGREGELSMFDLVHGTHLLEEYRAMKRAERINRKRKQYDLRVGVHACIARRST